MELKKGKFLKSGTEKVCYWAKLLVSRDKELKKVKLKSGGQKDVAPNILEIMGLRKPKEMTGESLIERG